MSWFGSMSCLKPPLCCFRQKCDISYATGSVDFLRLIQCIKSTVSSELKRRGDTRYISQGWPNCQRDEIILQMLTGERALNHDRQNISPVAST